MIDEEFQQVALSYKPVVFSDGTPGIRFTVYDDPGPESPLIVVRDNVLTIEQAENVVHALSICIEEARYRKCLN